MCGRQGSVWKFMQFVAILNSDPINAVDAPVLFATNTAPKLAEPQHLGSKVELIIHADIATVQRKTMNLISAYITN